MDVAREKNIVHPTLFNLLPPPAHTQPAPVLELGPQPSGFADLLRSDRQPPPSRQEQRSDPPLTDTTPSNHSPAEPNRPNSNADREPKHSERTDDLPRQTPSDSPEKQAAEVKGEKKSSDGKAEAPHKTKEKKEAKQSEAHAQTGANVTTVVSNDLPQAAKESSVPNTEKVKEQVDSTATVTDGKAEVKPDIATPGPVLAAAVNAVSKPAVLHVAKDGEPVAKVGEEAVVAPAAADALVSGAKAIPAIKVAAGEVAVNGAKKGKGERANAAPPDGNAGKIHTKDAKAELVKPAIAEPASKPTEASAVIPSAPNAVPAQQKTESTELVAQAVAVSEKTPEKLVEKEKHEAKVELGAVSAKQAASPETLATLEPVVPVLPTVDTLSKASSAKSLEAAEHREISGSNSVGTAPRTHQALLKGTADRPSTTSGSAAHQIDPARFLQRVARAFQVASQHEGEVRLRLHPPELGAIKVEIQVRDGTLIARVQTETADARTAILDNLPALRERLADQGIQIEKFDVDLFDPSGGQPQQSGEELAREQIAKNIGSRTNSRTDLNRRAEAAEAAPTATRVINNQSINVIV